MYFFLPAVAVVLKEGGELILARKKCNKSQSSRDHESCTHSAQKLSAKGFEKVKNYVRDNENISTFFVLALRLKLLSVSR